MVSDPKQRRDRGQMLIAYQMTSRCILLASLTLHIRKPRGRTLPREPYVRAEEPKGIELDLISKLVTAASFLLFRIQSADTDVVRLTSAFEPNTYKNRRCIK